jgi:hypothetical protein
VRRFIAVASISTALVVAAISATPSSAESPLRTEESNPGNPQLIYGLCSFPLTFIGTTSTTVFTFFDESGIETMRIGHYIEQDTWSANGVTLVGLPYRWNFERTFDSTGQVTSTRFDGQFAVIPLPDGSTIRLAGMADAAVNGFVFAPVHGTPVDMTAFCDAFGG